MAEPNRKYTVHLDITTLERGTKMSSKNTEMTGLWVKGSTMKDGSVEEWEKFLMDWNAAEAIEEIEKAGVGAKVDIVMEKEGRFWNIKGVYNKGQVSTPPASGPPQGEPFAPGDSNIPEEIMVKPPAVAPLIIPRFNQFALAKAIELTTAMLQAGIIKAAKATPGVVFEGVLDLANRLVQYLENDGDTNPKSDVSPLASVEDNGPQLEEDDIPF